MSSNTRKYGLWALKIIAGLAFLAAGVAKLSGAPMMVATFDAIGFGQWFRYLTGAIETVSAVLLFVPGVQAFGALLLAATMCGAILAHILVLGAATGIPALVLLAITGTITFAYRGQLPLAARSSTV